MSHSCVTSTLSVRILAETRDQLENLSHATGRTKSFLAAEAIEHYLETQSWQIKAIDDTMKKADRIDAIWVDHQQIKAWLESWGTEKEPIK